MHSGLSQSRFEVYSYVIWDQLSGWLETGELDKILGSYANSKKFPLPDLTLQGLVSKIVQFSCISSS